VYIKRQESFSCSLKGESYVTITLKHFFFKTRRVNHHNIFIHMIYNHSFWNSKLRFIILVLRFSLKLKQFFNFNFVFLFACSCNMDTGLIQCRIRIGYAFLLSLKLCNRYRCSWFSNFYTKSIRLEYKRHSKSFTCIFIFSIRNTDSPERLAQFNIQILIKNSNSWLSIYLNVFSKSFKECFTTDIYPSKLCFTVSSPQVITLWIAIHK